jgi:hypothetical protein
LAAAGPSLLTALGGGGFAAAAFLPWATIADGPAVPGLTLDEGHAVAIGLALVALAGWMPRVGDRVPLFPIGVALVAVLDVLDRAREIRTLDPPAAFSIGLAVAAAAALLALVGVWWRWVEVERGLSAAA